MSGSIAVNAGGKVQCRGIKTLGAVTAVVFGILSAGPGIASATEPLVYFGGDIQNNPRVHLTFWGKNWNQYSGARSEIVKMFLGLSGSTWQGVLAQYSDYQGSVSGSVSFNYWTDESIAAPGNVSESSLESEIEYAIAQRGWPGPGVDNQYVVLPAPGSKYEIGFIHGCGRHFFSGKLSSPFSYSGWPEDEQFAGAGLHCAENDPSGQGRAWVGLLHTVSHEYAETVTDPITVAYAGKKTGWLNANVADPLISDDEIADKCANKPAGQLANGSYVTFLWSNAQNRCSVSDLEVTTAAAALNGNPGWVTVKGEVHSLNGTPVNSKEVKVKFFKWENEDWALKATVPTTVNNNAYELKDWNGVGPGTWIAQAVFPAQGGLGESSSNVINEGAFTVRDGYRIRNKASDKCLDVKDQSKEHGATIQQWDCLDPKTAQNQVFTLVPEGSYYQLVARHSGRCVDVTNAGMADGATFQQWTCNGGAQQKWQGVPVETAGGIDYIKLVAKHSGKCMDVPSGSKTNGVVVQQWSCSGVNQQKWFLQSVDSAPIPTETFLTVPEGERLNGQPGFVNAHGYVKTGGYGIGGQKVTILYEKLEGSWKLKTTAQPTLNSEGFYEYKYMELGPGEWRMKTEYAGSGQLAGSASPNYVNFTIGNGYQLKARNSGKCLDLTDNNSANGTAMQQWDCQTPSPTGSQTFTVAPRENGAYFHIEINSSSKCVDVIGAGTGNGVKLQQWACAFSPLASQQLWQLIPIAGQEPWLAFKAKHSGRCMDVEGSSQSNGGKIQQWDCNWTPNQQWKFVPVG